VFARAQFAILRSIPLLALALGYLFTAMMAICRSIIESHGGRIWISDNPGGGTVFHLTVPYASPTAASDRPAASVGASS
jgi:Histidine kinase-, DNA gyrase B-, and HSP90-like ATPase